MNIIERIQTAFENGEDFNFTQSDIGELKELELNMLKYFAYYTYFEGLHGQGLNVVNYHFNNELEALDSFIDSARVKADNVI